MVNKWLDVLKEEESKHNTTALRVRDENNSPRGGGNGQTPNNSTDKTDKIPTDAEQLGLVSTWSIEFGFVSVHDPATGEWHDIPTKEAPGWALSEARKRKEFYRGGNRKAYRLTSCEMDEIWEAGHSPDENGIVEEDPIEEEGERI